MFHPCTYQHKVKKEVLNDPVQRRAFEVQISEFGQTPKQIFFKRHPQKFSDVFKPADMPKAFPTDKNTFEEEAKDVYKPNENKLDLSMQRGSQNSFHSDEVRKLSGLSKIQEIPKVAKHTPHSQQAGSPKAAREKGESAVANLENYTRITVTSAHKQEITSLHFYLKDASSKNQKLVSTSSDGFIKMWDSSDASLKKSFFVCQSGIVAATPISSEDSFALAGADNNIYLFSFLTGTAPQQFYAHDDTITAMCFKKVSGSPN